MGKFYRFDHLMFGTYRLRGDACAGSATNQYSSLGR
jgi:hypothetical protein